MRGSRRLLAEILEDARRALTAADAHRDQTVAPAAPAQLIEQRDRQLRAGRAQRMAQRDRAAVDVQLLDVELQLPRDRQRLRCKRPRSLSRNVAVLGLPISGPVSASTSLTV